jgi:PAS domain S-box-containing protein
MPERQGRTNQRRGGWHEMVGKLIAPKTSEDTLRAFARLLALTSSREPLVALLDELLRFAEQLTPEMRCSILLADLSAGVLRSGAAPSLSKAYTRAIDGLPIADGVGSCGTAAARREMVVVSEIASSPLWFNYAGLAREHGLGACWSVPLMDSRGVLLGTCAMYYEHPRTPTRAEEDLIEITGNLAAMVIQRHRDTEDLRASEARYRQLTTELQLARGDLQAILDNVPARITSWDAASMNCFANRLSMAEFGVNAAEIVGKHVRDVIGEERYGEAKPYIEAALSGEERSHEQIEPQADGSQRYSHVAYIPKSQEGAIVGLYAFATDVTEVRNSYQRIRELVQRLETVREDERRSVARVLHEGIAQDLFALKLRVEHIQARAADQDCVKETCQELAEALGKCMLATRQIANDLQPNALAHLALPVALREHARYFGEISGLTVRIVEVPPIGPIAEETSLILFRAAQEALTNVARHARASRVDIVLRTEAHSITMEIVDDGIGIEDTALAKAGCLGLLGIQERVGAIGGALAVLINREGGTTVVVQAPVMATGRAMDPARVCGTARPRAHG